ncbi:MAG: PepSY domain-containing protein [Bacteroidales bacterium]|jgi:uncharacterized iron-regulated membrane protein
MSTNMQGKVPKKRNYNLVLRKTHSFLTVFLFINISIIAITGILLGLKKQTKGVIMPVIVEGTTSELKQWISIDSIYNVAINEFLKHYPDCKDVEISRIDIRQGKAMANAVFDKKYFSVQVDGATGQVLYAGKRYSDMIENIHDGSIVDILIGSKTQYFKIAYTCLMGLSLLLFSITGFMIWLSKRKRKRRT